MSEWVKGKVLKITRWSNRLFSLTMEAPIAPFIAGQFTKLALELDGITVKRAYSYVNAPSSANLEFYLVLVPDGKLTPRLAKLHPGLEVLISKEASGYFVLNKVPQCETLWMLGTGTAIGPFLSMLQEGTDLEQIKQVVLVHAARFADDLNYLPLMQQLQKRYKGKIRIQTIVSREIIANSLTGRIPALIKDGSLETAVGLSMHAEGSHVMLCGNPQMVRDTQKILQEQRHMRKHLSRQPGHISSENYW
ncbi:Ferredoxin--NADP reductase [Serratia symbiotica]|nr:Ferredoxin--NADP reductase [Serratia symbiotica]